MPMKTTVYAARRILTMDSARPEATHVAVRDGRIVGVGSLDGLAGLGPHDLDERFADAVLLPGFVEGHTHSDAGNVWQLCYCGSFDRIGPDGRRWRGLRRAADVLDRLRAADRPGEPLVFGWGFDPLFVDRGFTREDLDRASADKPVVVMHASGHVANVNTAALRVAGLLDSKARHDGLPRGPDGLPTGELRGVEILLPAAHALGIVGALSGTDEAGAWRFAQLAARVGITTVTDLGNLLDEPRSAALLAATAHDDFPVRIVSALMAMDGSPQEVIAHARALQARSTERLRFGSLKIVLDGSIQGFSARLRPPGYHDGAPNGLWYMAPEQVRGLYEAALRTGFQVHAHANGDEAAELALECLEVALARCPRANHRYTLQHAQMLDRAQLERMRRLGMGANFFANHLYYWGDVHVARTIGPERAARMNPCGTALELGVPFSIHSDEPVTPMAPLFTAWCAVNRTTARGEVLGPAERIPVAAALHAITLGSAWLLRLDREIGSIEAGKRADFAVLEEDPLAVPPQRLKDIAVRGTVAGGRWFARP